MTVQVFFFLPESDEAILNIGEQPDDFQGIMQNILLLLNDLHQYRELIVFYDEENLKKFLQKCKTIIDESYLQKPETTLRLKLGKTARNLKAYPHKQSDCIYLWWRIDDLSIDYAHTILAEITERMLAYPGETYLLLNMAGAITTERSIVTIFKDAKHHQSLPEKFVRIPYVVDPKELEIWLGTHHQPTFSLLDRNRFRRTSYYVQGKAVFEELTTGYFWYLDNLHKNEYEIFDTNRQHIGVANLQGEIDCSKKAPGRTF